jgi:hypothetical protein
LQIYFASSWLVEDTSGDTLVIPHQQQGNSWVRHVTVCVTSAAFGRLPAHAQEFTPFFAPSLNDAHGHTVIRLSMGVLLRTIVDHMRDAATSATTGAGSQPLVYLFSGKDGRENSCKECK